jgi:hypothetical protein
MSSVTANLGASSSSEISFPRKMSRAFTKMLQDTDGAGTFFRLICYVGEGCEMALGRKALFSYLTNHVNCANVFDALPARSVKACFQKSGAETSLGTQLKNHSYIAVNFACIPLLLQDLKAINLAQVALNIGNKVKPLQFLGKLSLVTIVKSLLIFANVCGAVDAGIRLRKNEFKTTFDKNATLIELVAHVASVAFYALGFVVGISHAPIVVLGVIAYGLGVSRVLHKFAHKEEEIWKQQSSKGDKV